MRLRKHQAGVSIIKAILIVVGIGIVGTAGWLVYQHNRVRVTHAAASNTSTTSQQANTPSSVPSPTAKTGQSVVKIPELDIQITVPDDIKDLTYQASSGTLNDGRQDTWAKFSTTALIAIDSKCGTNFGPLGVLSKISGQYPTTFSDSNPPMEYGVLVKQFPAFFISSTGSQAGCSKDGNALNAMSKFKQEFTASFPTIQALN